MSTSTTSRIVDEILASDQATRDLVRWAVAQVGYLESREEWDAEDNYATTEELVEQVKGIATADQIDWDVIAIESGCEIECADCGELFSCDPDEVRLYGGKCPECVSICPHCGVDMTWAKYLTTHIEDTHPEEVTDS